MLNEVNDSSTKIKEIIEKFENIDREAFIEISQIAENDDYFETNTKNLLSDAKNSVTQYMLEMKELSQTQTSLLDNLKSWFQNLGESEKFLNKEQDKTIDIVNNNKTIEFMSNYIHETEEKMEKAQSIHLEVSRFLVKQMAQFKKEIFQKNGEISHLKESIDKIEASNNKIKTRRSTRKEKAPKSLNQSNSELTSKLENQIRTIEEQKHQIENLKNQLQSAQGQIGLSISSDPSSTDQYQLKMAEKENEISRLKFESESQVQILQQRVQQLDKQSQRLQNDLILEREKVHFSENQLNNANLRIKELDISVQKYVKLLDIERNKPQTSGSSELIIETSNDSLLEERMLEIAQCKEEIRELKLKHKEDLFEQADTLRSKFAIEKQHLLESIETGDGQALIQSIISEYESKLDEQRKNYEELKTNLAHQWGSKLSLLTRQYEMRIKNQQASNEVALLRKKEEIQYEVQKAKLELDDEFNKKILEISQSYSNQLAMNESLTDKLKIQNEEMKKEIEGYKEILKLKNSDEKKDELSQNQEVIAFNPIENLLDRTDVIKKELKEQKNWEFEQQRAYYTQTFQKLTEENQKELRNLLLSLQDSLSRVDSEGENSITISEALAKISDAFVTLNSHFSMKEKDDISNDDEEKISLKEASDRMDFLKNKIISLTSENNELRKGNPNTSSVTFDSENEQLRMKVKYLESLQKGDIDETIKILQKIEQELRMEIEVKDTIIDQLKARFCSLSFENKIIFAKEPSENNQQIIYKNSLDATNYNHRFNFLEINFTEGYLEIHPEYFEEEEELFENEESENQLKASSETKSSSNDPQLNNSSTNSISKTIVKTKVKTVIKEIPKIEYRDRPKASITKYISPLIAIEIYAKTSNLSLLNSQSMTLEFAVSSNNQNCIETKVIDEKIAEALPTNNINRYHEELKITDTSFLSADPALLKKKFEEENKHSIGYFNRPIATHPPQIKPEYRIINQTAKHSNDDTPIPPPNSPNLIYADASTNTDKVPIALISLNNKEIKKASLFISNPILHVNIPNRIVSIMYHPVRILRKEGPMIISEYNICSFEPHPPPPIVIASDEETKARIDDLQEQLQLKSSSTKEQKIRNDLLRQIPEVNVSFRDRTIATKDHIIDSLHARIAATEDQLKRIREQKLIDIRRKSRAFYSVPRGNISGPLVVDSPTKTETAQNIDLSSISSVGVSRPELKVKNENRQIKSESSVPNIDKKKSLVTFEKIESILSHSDPMDEVIQILQRSTAFLTNQIEIGQQIITEFNGDINAFESFLKATKSFDENSGKFIDQIKLNHKLISEYHSQFGQLSIRQNQVLSLLKDLKKNYEKNEVVLTDNEKLKMQEKILNEIQKKSENVESSIDPSIIIEQIQASLRIIDDIGLIEFDEEENRTLRTIHYKVNHFKEQLSNNEKIETSELDSLLTETQSFISGIKPKIKLQPNLENQNLHYENEKLKKQIHKIKKARNASEKELSLLKDKEISFETQINLLKNRLSEQEEIAENSTSLYFTQMDSLKSIVSQIANGDQNSNFIDQIKNEILNLQTISLTAVREKDLFKEKANEAEDRLMQADAEKASAIRELNEIKAKYEKLDLIVKKAYEEKMFFESDITKLKTEKAIEVDAKMKLKNQISQLIEDNTNTNEILKKKREKIKLLKKQLNSLKSENDELTIQVTFGLYRRRDIPKTTKETQTMFVKVKKRTNENDNSNKMEKQTSQAITPKSEAENATNSNIITHESNQNEKNNFNSNEPKQNDESHTEEEEKYFDENEPIDANFDLQESNSKLTKTHSENSNSQNTLSRSDSSVSSQFEWQEEIDQDTYTDNVIHTEQVTKQSFENIEKGEKAVSVVHSPLKVKKKKTTILQQPQKTYMSPKSNKTRPKTVVHASRTQVNSEELAIGSVTPGKRQLTGATQSPKPIIPQKSLHAIVNLQVLKPLESAMTTTNYEDCYASTQPVTPKNHHGSPLTPTMQKQRKVQHQQPQLFYAENDKNGLSETVRITKYDVEGVTQNMTPKSPLIAPSISEQQLSSSQQHINQLMLPKMAEVHKVMVRLREKIVKLQAKLDKKTEIISDLKKKLADSVSENKQQRLAILKAEDESKRAVHRFDSLKVRYDIIFKELSTKNDDLTECKREIYELRKIAAPAASSLSRLRNAQDEQLRILQEKERQKGMISLARSAITNVTSTEAQRHLNMLMRNTKKSIARLEAKRRIWKEVEKKQVMGALGALSLIDDKKSLFSLKRSISTVYNSPFRSKLIKKNISSSVDMKIDDDLSFLIPEMSSTLNNRAFLVFRSEQALNLTPVFAKQLENINRLKPELSENEKKQIIRGNIQPDLVARIKATEKEREEQEKMDDVIITPVKK